MTGPETGPASIALAREFAAEHGLANVKVVPGTRGALVLPHVLVLAWGRKPLACRAHFPVTAAPARRRPAWRGPGPGGAITMPRPA